MPERKAKFTEPTLLLRTEKLPEGPEWVHELKFDGYRACAIKTGGKMQLCSRNHNDLSVRYPGIVKALASKPDETVIDGEVSRSMKTASHRSTCCRTTAPALRCVSSSSTCRSSRERM